MKKKLKNLFIFPVSGFHRKVDENCVHLGRYAAQRDLLTPEDGTDRLSRYVGTELPLYAT